MGALMGAIALAASTDVGTHVLTAAPKEPDIQIPKSARGNGSRARCRYLSRPAFDRAGLKRRRKLALASKRQNRRRA